MNKFFAYINKDKKKYYFTGDGFDTNARLKKTYSSEGQLSEAITPHYDAVNFNRYSVYSDTVKTTSKKTVKRGRKKNPVKSTRNSRIGKAVKGYKNFTGHEPKFIDKLQVPQMKEGFKFGDCDGIMYTTVRDGRTEKYIHEFKNSSRPILVSNFDGDFIALLGGNYSFTEQGIVDK